MKQIFLFMFTVTVFTLTVNAQWTGDGTETNPYKITTVNELKEFSSYVGVGSETSGIYWELGSDINMEGITDFTPIGTWENNNYRAFAGTFNGNGKKITNLKINSGDNYIGLFGYNIGTILNVGIENCSIEGGENCTGGLVGQNNGTISNCYITGTVTSSSSTNRYTGGLVGFNNGRGIISNCYAASSVITKGNSSSIGGLLGGNNGSIFYCYAESSISTISTDNIRCLVGGLIGKNEGNISNSFAAPLDITTNSSTKGILIGHDTPGTITHCYHIGEVSGITANAGNVELLNVSIKTIEELQSSKFAQQFNNCNTPVVWQYKAGSFPVLKSQNISGATDPLCPPTFALRISNITKTSASFNSGYTAGNNIPTVTGFKLFTGNISNPESAEGRNISGTVTTDFTVTETDLTQGTLYTLFAYAVIVPDTFYSVPTQFITIAWDGDGTANNPYQISTIEHLKALSTLVINDTSKSTDPPHKNSYNKHWKLMNNINMAGIENFIPIGGWSLTGTQQIVIAVERNFFAGTFEGNNKKIENLSIDEPRKNSVALFGYSKGTIRNVGIENVNISGKNYTAGLVGYNSGGNVSNCYATGTVRSSEATDPMVGGLVAYSSGDVSNCYATCSVSNPNNNNNTGIGGLVGVLHNGNVSHCYAAPSAINTPSTTKGVLIGNFYSGTITNCYHLVMDGINSVGTGTVISGTITAKTDAELKHPAMVAGLNNGQTPSPWKSNLTPNLNNGYPLLSWQEQTYTVTFAKPANGKLTVKDGNRNILSGTKLPSGTVLTITATPTDGYQLESLKVNGTIINNGDYTVTSTTNITATFKKVPTSIFPITFTQPDNGRVTVKNGNMTIFSGQGIPSGTVLTIVATPDNRYILDSLMVNGTANDGSYTVTSATTIAATFKTITTSIEKESKELKLYPNPATTIIRIENIDTAESIQIYDLSGKEVLNTIAQNEIDISMLPPGIYTVKAGNYKAKFIKQ